MKNLLGLAALVLVLAATLPSQGQNATPRPRLTPELALARLCVSEAGWECFDTGDALGIHEVILRGAARQGIRYESYARAYARRLFGARPHDVARLRWVGELNTAGDAPPSWPTTVARRRGGVVTVEPHPPWSQFRARWLAVLERARETVTVMTLDDVDEWGICDLPVQDWGGHVDRNRAARIGLVEVDCGETRNDFYCRPSDPTCVEIDRD